MATDTSRGPYDRPTKAIFYNYLKAMNPRMDYGLNQFTIEDIGRNTDATTRVSFNTQAVVTGIPSAGRSGTWLTRWVRRDIAQVFANCHVQIPYAEQATLSALLPAINSAYPIQLAASDIYDANLPVPASYPLTVHLRMHKTNPAFIGVLTLTLGAPV